MNVKTNKLTKVLLALAFVLCVVASVFSLNTASAATEEDVMLYPGGSIRYEAPAGIRFTAFVSDSLFDDVATHDLKDGVTVGMYVVPAMYTDDGVTEITSSTKGVKAVSSDDAGFLWRKTSGIPGFQQFDVAIVNIPDTAYGEDILARAFVNDGGEVLSDTVIRSIAGVANFTLAADQLVDIPEDKLVEEEITALNGYVSGEAVDAPVLSVLDGEVSWTSSASEYLVKRPDGSVLMTNATELNVSEGAVSVVAVGDGVNSTYSAPATKTVHALTANQLASFDDASYVEDLEAGKKGLNDKFYHKPTNEDGSFGFLGTPTVKEDSINLAIKINTVVNASSRFAVFTVNLQKSLDVDKGVKLSFNYVGHNAGVSLEGSDFYIFLAGPDSTEQGYTADGSTKDAVASTKIEVGNDYDLVISPSQLQTYYEDGDTSLTFIIWSSRGVSYGYDFAQIIELKDLSQIEYYTAPTNLALNGTTLTWDPVDGATSYVVNVKGVDVATVSETSYDLTAHASASFAVKVKAIGADKGDSLYSAPVNYVYKEKGVLAAFNSAAYEGSVKIALENNAQPWTGNQQKDGAYANAVKEYRTGVDGANDGDALFIQPVIAHYANGGNAKIAVFTITLDEPLDLSGETYDGIVLRFKPITSRHAGLGGAMCYNPITIVQLCTPVAAGTRPTGDRTYTDYKDSESSSYPYPSTGVSQGQWIEWTLSNADLATLYSDGATEIVFALVVPGAAGKNLDVTADAYLDTLSYYKD